MYVTFNAPLNVNIDLLRILMKIKDNSCKLIFTSVTRRIASQLNFLNLASVKIEWNLDSSKILTQCVTFRVLLCGSRGISIEIYIIRSAKQWAMVR